MDEDFRASLRIHWRWVLPAVFVLITTTLLAFGPSQNSCPDIARGNNACMSLPELFANLINGPGIYLSGILPEGYLSGRYVVIGRLAGVFVMWFWLGWLLETRQGALVPLAGARWLRFATYLPAILVCAARVYVTARFDRVDTTYVVQVWRQSGIAFVLQTGGQIWVDRALVGWLTVLLILLIRESLPVIRLVQTGYPKE